MLWNYEDITAKVWSIRSGEQLDTFLQHVLRIFQESLPHALINERWAQTALHLGLSCSSRHYAGRSLQVSKAASVSTFVMAVVYKANKVHEMLEKLLVFNYETVTHNFQQFFYLACESIFTL